MLKVDSRKLVLIRAERGLTVENLAKKAGISYKTLFCIEKNKSKPTPITIGKLAKALDVSLEDLLIKED